MATKLPRLTQKIAETRAKIDDLARQIERAHQQIEVEKIKLQAYLELDGSKPSAAEMHKAVEKAPKRKLFVAEIPWDRALATIRSKVGFEFSTNDLVAALAGLKHQPKRSTVRDKLADLVRKGALKRTGANGVYHFVVAEKRAA